MVDSFGTALRAMRLAAGLTLNMLATRANVSKPHIGHLEAGARQPTERVAHSIDTALGGGGVLVDLAALEREDGDDMRRRALLATIGAATGLGALAGPHTMGDLVRHGLLDAAGTGEDWGQVLDDCGRRLVTDSSPLYGAAVLTNLMVLRERLATEPTPDLFRAAAGLGQIYGLWLGNSGHLGGAAQWYRSAATLADRSGDTSMRAWVRGRAASRAVYEGWTIRQTLDAADTALSMTSRPTVGAVEAHAARVSVHALDGDVERGRAAVRAMADIVERLPDADLMGLAAPHARTLFLSAFLECRVGSLDDALRACELAEPALRDQPLWLAETQVYRARALVAAGDVLAGLGTALATVQGLQHDVRVIGVAVRDTLSCLPAGHRSDEADRLAAHADRAPGPWETLRA